MQNFRNSNCFRKFIQPQFILTINSKILDYGKKYKKHLIQWLEKPNDDKNSENLKNIILLYRGSIDSFSTSKFHEKCNNKGETLTIIKTEDNYIFGGYTEN